MLKRVHFPSSVLPYLLVAPQVLITLVFFIWPASQALYQSFLIEDPFGLSTEFVWFENFTYLWGDEIYIQTFWRTAFFSVAVAALAPNTWRFCDRRVGGVAPVPIHTGARHPRISAVAHQEFPPPHQPHSAYRHPSAWRESFGHRQNTHDSGRSGRCVRSQRPDRHTWAL